MITKRTWHIEQIGRLRVSIVFTKYVEKDGLAVHRFLVRVHNTTSGVWADTVLHTHIDGEKQKGIRDAIHKGEDHLLKEPKPKDRLTPAVALQRILNKTTDGGLTFEKYCHVNARSTDSRRAYAEWQDRQSLHKTILRVCGSIEEMHNHKAKD